MTLNVILSIILCILIYRKYRENTRRDKETDRFIQMYKEDSDYRAYKITKKIVDKVNGGLK